VHLLHRLYGVDAPGDSDVISFHICASWFRRHLAGKTHKCLLLLYDLGLNTVCWQDIAHTDIFINQRIECYINNTINLRP